MQINCLPAPSELGATDRLAKALSETFVGETATMLLDGLFTHPYEEITSTYQPDRQYFYDNVVQTENGPQPQIFYWRFWGYQVPNLVDALIKYGMKVVDVTEKEDNNVINSTSD